MITPVYTIGYEGASLEDFLDTLADAKIARVVDVRDVPASRRRGFSKNALREALADYEIEYTHLKALGDPKAGREAMRRGDISGFLEIFNEHIQSVEAQTALMEAVELASKGPIVLLCYERDPKYCHRSIVVERMSALASVRANHLGVRKRTGASVGRQAGVIATIG
ncbi:MAG: DUF488 family protein [Chakrabartia godavariana]